MLPHTGSCCEREDRRAWGDPHLETLDAISFDFFGIGQYWDCKSEKNDFGYQVSHISDFSVASHRHNNKFLNYYSSTYATNFYIKKISVLYYL